MLNLKDTSNHKKHISKHFTNSNSQLLVHKKNRKLNIILHIKIKMHILEFKIRFNRPGHKRRLKGIKHKCICLSKDEYGKFADKYNKAQKMCFL